MFDQPSRSTAQTRAEFTEFAAASQQRLLRYADLLCGDRGRAENLVQGALVKVYLGWWRLRQGNPEAYARTIITHAHTDWWRRKPWREVSTFAPPPQPTDADMAAELAERDSIMRALESLSSREPAVIVLRYYSDLSEAEIALEVGCAVGTVKSTAAHAVAKLRTNRNLISEVTGK